MEIVVTDDVLLIFVFVSQWDVTLKKERGGGDKKCSMENRTGYQVTNYVVSSGHEVVSCTKIHIRYYSFIHSFYIPWILVCKRTCRMWS
jgi:hypothetical protein